MHVQNRAADFVSRLELIDKKHGSSNLIRKHVPSAYAWAIAKTLKKEGPGVDEKIDKVSDYSIFDKKVYVAKYNKENVAVQMVTDLLDKAKEVNQQMQTEINMQKQSS